MQFDVNLVLYDENARAIWYTGTTTGAHAVLQGDGNFVVYDAPYQNAVWNSGTPNNGGSHLSVQTDGNVVVYPDNGPALRATGTCCR